MKAETAGYAAVIGIWLVYVILCLGVTAGVIWAAFHFAAKYW